MAPDAGRSSPSAAGPYLLLLLAVPLVLVLALMLLLVTA
jgi:hypothetical protein